MRILVQRALEASVSVDHEVVGAIAKGLLLLVGFTQGDGEDDLGRMAKKVAHLRIFPDADGKMNKNVTEAGGAILSVSQFTLYGDATEGNRPSFTSALPGPRAEPLWDRFNQILAEAYGLRVETGRFGAEMAVRFTNDGPVTLLLETRPKP